MLCGHGFHEVQRRGSHVKLRRFHGGQKQILTVPDHHELDRGTLRAIFRQACRFLPADDLQRDFYTRD
jgi:predicted RNA binding protein YcfA (HicA-like mRNA interferase family)